MKRVWIGFLCLMMLLAAAGCGSSGSDTSESTMPASGEEVQMQEYEMQEEDFSGKFVVMDTDAESESEE